VPPSSTSAGTPGWRSHAATPWLSFSPTLADDASRPAIEFGRPFSGFCRWPPDGAGNKPRVGGEILIGLNVDGVGHAGVPIKRMSLSIELVSSDDMGVRP
jgi:hypothetical protein